MPVTSNRRTVEERLDRGLRAGVNAAAERYLTAMKRALIGGYTSGRFYQGGRGVQGSLRRTVAQTDERGNVFAAVGTDVKYAKWWEMGHYNIYVRHWVRAERWRPTLVAEADAMVNRFRAAARIAAGVEIGSPFITDAEAPE